MINVTLNVNGDEVTANVEARTLLVDYLREHLKLTGTHIGCETSQCGACSIHVDGKLVKSCAMFVFEADGVFVETIESQADSDGSLNAVQKAFQTQHGLQCGFCTPGMVMAATALLRENPMPNEAEIRDYLEGNICRCTGYQNIVKSILVASGQEVPADV